MSRPPRSSGSPQRADGPRALRQLMRFRPDARRVRILVLGDIHGRFDAIWTAYERTRPRAILQVGDLAARDKGERRFDVGTEPDKLPPAPFVWVLGNHERLDACGTVGKRLGFFGTSSMGGLRIVGVGGIPGSRRPVHWAANGALARLAEVHSAEILLTHGTCGRCEHPRGRTVGSEEPAAHCARIRPATHSSGHHHFAGIARNDGILHVRLPHAWEGYAVHENDHVTLMQA